MAAHLARLLLSAVLLTADAGNFSQNISFQDLHGKLNYLRLRNGSLQWCAEKRCHQPKSLQLDFNSSLEGDAAGCKYHVIGQLPDRTTSRPSATKLDLTAMPPHIGPGPLILRDGMMAQPATKPLVKSLIPTQVQLSANFLGPLQRDLVREMQMMAKQAGVPISGSALDELSAPAAGEVGTDEGLSFPVPLQPTGNIFIVLNWTNATEPCVAVVPHPEDCSTCSFGPDSCRANSRLEGPDKETLLSYQLPRQPFMLTDDLNARHEHSVCIREANGTVPSLRLLGRIAYYRKPQVSFIKNILIIGVRTFINPGWHEEIHLQCTNCSAASQVVVQPISYDSRCRSVTQQMLAALAVANRHEEMPASVDISELRNSQMEEAAQHGTTAGINCPVPSSGPCSGYADGAFAVGYRKSTDYDDTSHATFILDSSRRLTGHEKQIFFHHRSAICLYPGGPAAHGWLVGFAVVHMNVLDMQAFIGFVCFFGVALPLLCLVTALLHYNKYERCKHHVRQLRLEYQREQLERELATGEEEVETGTMSRQRSGNVPSSSSRDTGPVRPPEMNYQVLSGEPRASTSSAFLRPS